MNSFVEYQPWGKTSYEVEPYSYVMFETSVQRVEFITNPSFGRMLFLDGVLQSASLDEIIYHKALVPAELFEFPSKPRRVLIAGGAEGAVAREVLKHECVERCVMVDWDEKLVAHCRDIEILNRSAFTDPRLKYVCQDIMQFCNESNEQFDLVFLDLLDMDTDADLDFMKSIVSLLFEKGTWAIVLNVGRKKYLAELLIHFRSGTIKEIIVPSFQEPWYIVTLTPYQ